MARLFDGVDDRVKLALGTANFAFGPGTIAAICQLSSDTAATRVILGAGEAAASRYLLSIDGSDQLQFFCNGNNRSSVITLLPGDGWALICATKATGTVAPRFHKYVYSTNTWTHTTAVSTLANSAVPDLSASFGTTGTGTSPFPGDIQIGAVWNVVLTDAQVESLAFGLPAWFQVQPKGLWLLDQDSTGQKVVDLTGGGANESALTGTTVSTSNVPVFTYGHPVLGPIGGGATTHTVDTAESGTATDANAVTAEMGATLAETGTAADSDSVAATFPVSLSESGAATTSESVTPVWAGTVTESATAAETNDVIATMGVSLAESGSAASSESVAADIPATVTEAGSAADANSVAWTTAGSLDDVLAATETEDVGNLLDVSLDESAPVTSTESVQAVLAGTVTEAGTTADTNSGVATFAGSNAEALTASTTEAVAADLGVTLTDALTAAETNSAGALVNASLSESAPVSSTESGQLTIPATMPESVTAAETSSVAAALVGSNAETLAATDTGSVIAEMSVTQDETGEAADVAAALAELLASLADQLSAEDESNVPVGTLPVPPYKPILTVPGTDGATMGSSAAGPTIGVNERRRPSISVISV